MPGKRPKINAFIPQIERELLRRYSRLCGQRKRLLTQLHGLDLQLAQASSTRPPLAAPESLTLALVAACGERPLTPAQAAIAVKKSGHRSRAKNFKLLVKQQLVNGSLFMCDSRGRFSLR